MKRHLMLVIVCVTALVQVIVWPITGPISLRAEQTDGDKKKEEDVLKQGKEAAKLYFSLPLSGSEEDRINVAVEAAVMRAEDKAKELDYKPPESDKARWKAEFRKELKKSSH